MYFNKWPPRLARSRIHSFSTFYSSCFLATRVCPRLDPLRLHTGLGLARTPAILYDPGCRLHILRLRTQVCDDARISSCDPVQVFTFPDGITSASGRVQMSLHPVGITHGPRDSPRANQLLDNSAVVTFMVLPSQTKIDLRTSPWLARLLPTRRGSAQACRWICCWSLVRGVCCYCMQMYVYVVETAACIAYIPARVCRLVMMFKYSCTMNAFVQAIQLVSTAQLPS
jgi:hypothetical protein